MAQIDQRTRVRGKSGLEGEAAEFSGATRKVFALFECCEQIRETFHHCWNAR
jgi:hypothetical protein